MTEIMQGTTNVLHLNIDLTNVTDFTISFSQRGVIVLQKRVNDCIITEDGIDIPLNASETAKFDSGSLLLARVNASFEDGSADATRDLKIKILYNSGK